MNLKIRIYLIKTSSIHYPPNAWLIIYTIHYNNTSSIHYHQTFGLSFMQSIIITLQAIEKNNHSIWLISLLRKIKEDFSNTYQKTLKLIWKSFCVCMKYPHFYPDFDYQIHSYDYCSISCIDNIVTACTCVIIYFMYWQCCDGMYMCDYILHVLTMLWRHVHVWLYTSCIDNVVTACTCVIIYFMYWQCCDGMYIVWLYGLG